MKNVATRSFASIILRVLVIFSLCSIILTMEKAWSQTLSASPSIEFNSADGGDLGFHVQLDGSAWKQISIYDPTGKKIVGIKNQESVASQGLTSLAFESAEPPLAELPLEEFLDRFPEGEYTFVGKSINGEPLKTVAEFTHNIPDPPVIISPKDGKVVDRDDVVIKWKPVTSPADIEVDVYHLQIFPVDPPEGQDPISPNIDFNFEVPSSITAVPIQERFLVPDVEYQIEVTVVESGGNRTVTIATFKTAPEKKGKASDRDDDDDDDDDD